MDGQGIIPLGEIALEQLGQGFAALGDYAVHHCLA